MKPLSTARRVRGLTLLEVLVALAVFATAALSVMKAVSQHLNTLGYLEEKTFAAMVADNEMAKIRLSGQIPTSVRRGKSELAGREWYWSIKSTQTADGYLRALDVTVATDEARKKSVVTLRTYVEN
ncbi:type II secretion system protein GspI [Photobacterium gaetbulicola]|uniref:Type II secretion system protein I n=2 Tax=Photobacterium gaetbulicola TaxID=1295392 RepID=A0A0C5WPD4_9GAMM|nr:type II secretion system minor pseudopilin GspI [Photobacterium gaetbulicola]AJR06934.1 putative type II secretory pathway, pseudopilin EpsI [Photobacterium gaetbulicola Gung47]KHT61757.1 general secretion pathway protein GspI [Photobacterium gaetbulicola]PSU05092.1 type II secretion system protein GspI [Photobacterium gaetbulicola]